MTWTEFLANYCHCYPNAVGNMPCDNGMYCDRCMTKEAKEMWEKLKNTKGEKRWTSQFR